VLVLHVVARLSLGPEPPEDELEGLERPELFGTKNRGKCQVDIPHANRVRRERSGQVRGLLHLITECAETTNSKSFESVGQVEE
jgi:hypothetical protein